MVEGWKDGILGIELKKTILNEIEFHQTHYSNIPEFQHSNWNKALNLGILIIVSLTNKRYE